MNAEQRRLADKHATLVEHIRKGIVHDCAKTAMDPLWDRGVRELLLAGVIGYERAEWRPAKGRLPGYNVLCGLYVKGGE